MSLLAQEVSFSGVILNAQTWEPLSKAKVILMTKDSMVVDSTKSMMGMFGGVTKSKFFFNKQKEGMYILRISHDGFETKYANIDATNFRKREGDREFGPYRLRRILKNTKDRELGEARVTATRVKIYAKGDTVVYNADAFQLAEGSMLDALIRQLPGVELKDDGQILVNGKKVESLLLNGEDFFKKDHSVMLDNLPSYMVNNVKVYERRDEMRKHAKQSPMTPKQLVMDVNLKKQYSIGWIANAEAATGSEARYMARFFALRFTPHSRLSLFGTMNNLNDIRRPGNTGEWSPSRMATGLLASKIIGLDYLVKDKTLRFKLTGNALLKYTDSEDTSFGNTVNFLSDGNTYERMKQEARNRNKTFETDHSFTFRSKKATLNINPAFSYQKYDNRYSRSFASFISDPLLYGGYANRLDSVYYPEFSALNAIMINRSLQNTKTSGNDMTAKINVNYYTKMKYSDDTFFIDANASFRDSEEDYFRHYRLDYPMDENREVDFRNQYIKSRPEQSYNYNVLASYSYLNDCSLSPYYKYSQQYKSGYRSLYNIEKLEGWGYNTEHSLGTLPSVTENILSMFDKGNSYYSRQLDTQHEVGLQYSTGLADFKNYTLRMEANVPLSFERNRLSYERNAIDTIFSRNNIFFNPSIKFELNSPDWNKVFTFNYNIRSTAPNMTHLLDIRNDIDPLYVTLGNAALKNTHNHRFSLAVNIKKPEKQRFLTANASYSIYQNAIAMGYIYNKKTGVRTTTPDNVNGNWNITGNINYTAPIDKAKRLSMSTNTASQFYNNVDLIGVEGATESLRSTVKSLYITETLRLDYRIKKIKIGAKVRGTWTNATSRREDFQTINAADFNYGATAQIELPWSMQLSTDLTVYSRRGYEDNAMNTDDIVWNARLSKRVMKGNLTFIFDILGNLSSITRSINAQGRTETYRNVIPSYVMLHAIYRLNIKPKKRPGE